MFETMKDSKFSLHDLEGRSYRDLQQLAKSLSLPSNVKKIYLIQLIHAKKFKTNAEVEAIVEQVKLERKKTSQARKIMTRKKKVHVQAAEITSTCRPDSPPIANTPRKSDHKYPQPRSQVNEIEKTVPSRKQCNSDRVLRSYNQRLRKQYFSTQKTIFNILRTENSVLRSIASQALITAPKQNKTSVLNHNNVCPKVLARHLLRNKRSQCLPDPVINFSKFGPRDLILLQERVRATNPQAFPNRQLIRSATQPHNHTTASEAAKNVRYECTQSVGFRRRDGKISKINALVQKKHNNRDNNKNIEITMQDLIDSNINSQNISLRNVPDNLTNMQYPNMSSVCPNPELCNNPSNKYYSNYANVNQRATSDVKALNTRVQRPQLPKPSNMPYQNSTAQYPSASNLYRGKTYNNTLHYQPIDQYPNFTSQEYPNIAFSDTEFVRQKPKISDRIYNEPIGAFKDDMTNCSVYYHKKIRGEQIRSQRTIGVEKDGMKDLNTLPPIAEVFNKFNHVHPASNVTQPIFVQVSDESERIFSYPIFAPRPGNTNMLESFYNIKKEFLVTQPLLQIATTNCKSVYSTSTITTAVAHASAAPTGDACFGTSCPPHKQYGGTLEPQNSCDIDIVADSETRTSLACQEYEDYDTTSPLDTSDSQILDSTIPEMVEDAMEIISQDGDYMERIEMDERMQCFLCSWAGPWFLLEYHIRKDHPNDIQKEDICGWHITYTLASLLSHQWLSRVIEHDSILYALNAKYEESDCIVVSLTTLSAELSPKIGSLTIHNKVTGEPYSWSGEITQLTQLDQLQPGLNVEVSTLNLLPNSANLQLVNGQLVVKSPTKVVVGHPELNDIHVILFVKIMNSVSCDKEVFI